MQLSLSLSFREPQLRPDARAEKLRAVLAAARKTDFYARRLRGTTDAEVALAMLPPVPLKVFLENREHFRSRKIAAGNWLKKLGFPAEALAGSQAELAALRSAPRGARRVVVYTRLGERLMDAGLRERLWEAFELPVFEQLRGFEGELLASECDAHEGLHLETGSAIFEQIGGELVVTSLIARQTPVLRLQTGLSGSIVAHECPCGASATRFLPAAAPAADRKPPAVEWSGRALALLAHGSR
ncbi:MAG: hypothetical protein ACM336_16060 [Acidobacteriota bacterium]